MIQNFLLHLTTDPGVYRMLDENGIVLYVGKAKNLKKRVSSYFNQPATSAKNKSLVSQIKSIEVSVTRSETEALLLESSLIKSLRPKYNILMRDDKSYPYIFISDHTSYPRITVIRSKHKPQNGEYFGPYPSTTSVRETINLLQKIFKLRPCTDIYFNSRSRPCLQYQINRCSAPCTKYISTDDYKNELSKARLFLHGKNQQILDELGLRMQVAVDQLAFEDAAMYRDQIKKLRLIQEQQNIERIDGNIDVIVIEIRQHLACVQVVSIRSGQIVAHENFFPTIPTLDSQTNTLDLWQNIFNTFITYFYFSLPERIPPMIITQHPVNDLSTLEQVLSDFKGSKCLIKNKANEMQKKWLEFATKNVLRALDEKITSTEIIETRYVKLMEFLKLSKPIYRMECFDISHTQGQFTVASCVVFDNNGPYKKDYRHFNIKNITPGDDYAAMEQALTRRFKYDKHPDILVIDGGLGQWRIANRILMDHKLEHIIIIGISKGPERKAGLEKLILKNSSGQEYITSLPENSPALHLLQHIRDESHRFAITAHRKKRNKSSFESSLNHIEGVGKARHKALLTRFGGLRELSMAPMEEILKVKGISLSLAQKIYDYYHRE